MLDVISYDIILKHIEKMKNLEEMVSRESVATKLVTCSLSGSLGALKGFVCWWASHAYANEQGMQVAARWPV